MATVDRNEGDDPPLEVEAPNKPSILSRLSPPVFFDFVWGDTASPLVSHAVVLRMIKCVLVVLTQATDFLQKNQKKKGKVAGAKAAANALKDKVRVPEWHRPSSRLASRHCRGRRREERRTREERSDRGFGTSGAGNCRHTLHARSPAQPLWLSPAPPLLLLEGVGSLWSARVRLPGAVVHRFPSLTPCGPPSPSLLLLQFKSLELFARFAYNTVTEDAFTCKSKKVAAFPKGLEVRPGEPLRTRIARTHPSPLSHQQASMILCGRPRCDASRKPFSQHPPVQAVPLLCARCGGPYAQPTRRRLSARLLAAGDVTEFTCSVETHSRPASASVLRWNGTARLLPLATITGLAYLIIFTMTGMHALQ